MTFITQPARSDLSPDKMLIPRWSLVGIHSFTSVIKEPGRYEISLPRDGQLTHGIGIGFHGMTG